MTHDEYVALARRSFASLCDLAVRVSRADLQNPIDPNEELSRMVYAFWHRLAWSDHRLDDKEYEVLRAILEEGNLRGLPLAEAVANLPAREDVPLLLVRAREYDLAHDTCLANAMVGHLESFGYALLAANRTIESVELTTLQNIVREWRNHLNHLGHR